MISVLPADLIKRYDVRTLGDLVNDDGTQATPAELLSHDVVLTAIETAIGEMYASCLRGNRYTTTDLENLTGPSLAYAKHLVCKIAFWLIYERRPLYDIDQYEIAKQAARGALDQLKRGETIFDVAAVESAGQPSVVSPTRVQLQNNGLMRDRLTNYFPPRHLPNGQ
jgi:hypothetical protein